MDPPEYRHQRSTRSTVAGSDERTKLNTSVNARLEQGPKQQKRDEAMWQACRIAHAILGLDEADECDPSGVQRRAALTALAHQFLHGAHRKPIPVIVRAKPLQQADIRGLYRIILMCFEMQFDQVFKSLADEARR